MTGTVISVSRRAAYGFSKDIVPDIRLLAGEGVEGDAHCGRLVKHRSRMASDPTQPNLRQAHLLHSELLDELFANGFNVNPGDLGENILTRGIDLLSQPVGTRLLIGTEAILELTGLRNPCSQIENFRASLLDAVLERAADGRLIRKAGVMAIILRGGTVMAGDAIRLVLPAEPHHALERV